MAHTTAEEVRTWRELLGWTVEEAAARLELEAETLRRWEAGSIAPPAYVKLALQRLGEMEARRIAAEEAGPV